MKKKGITRILCALAVTTLTIALCGCAGDKGVAESSITIGIPQDLDSLDPNKAVAAGTKEVLFNMYEGLVKVDSNGNIIPAVASEYVLSDDGLTYTFTLRDGIKFHNGNLVTVEDIKYTVDKCADTSMGDPLIPAFSNVSTVNVVDDAHVEIVLKEKNTDFISELATVTASIVPKDNNDLETNPVGTGPYKFVSRSMQENFVVEMNNDYWGEKAHIKDVTFKICANADSIVMDLEGGSVDMYARVTSTQAAELSDEFEILEGTMNLVQALYLNNAVSPFDDVRVRQALCYCIDPQEIMDMVSDGKGVEIGSSMFPSFGKYYVEELNDTYNQDYDKAKELLAEAGYADGFSFTITVPSNYQQHIDTAQVLVEEFKKAGIDASIELIEWDSWLSDVYAGRNYQSTVIGVDASSLTASALLGRFVSDAGNNFVNFTHSEYDKAYNAAKASVDDAERTELFKQCETILSTEAANVYIQDLPEFVALNKKFGGYEFYPMYIQDISKLYVK